MMFNVGDVITAVENAPYSITTNESILQVIETLSEERIRVKILSHASLPNEVGEDYIVEEKHFVLIENARKETETKMKYNFNETVINTIGRKIGGLLDTYDHKNSPEGIRKILETYKTNKGWLVSQLSKHPNWDGENLAIVFSTNYERGIDINNVSNFVSWFIDRYENKYTPIYAAKYMGYNAREWCHHFVPDKIRNEKEKALEALYYCEDLIKYRYWTFSPENYNKFMGPIYVVRKIIECDYSNGDEIYSFLAEVQKGKGKITKEQAEVLNDLLPALKAVAGQKLSRIIRKLGDITGLSDIKEIRYNGRDYGWNRQFAIFADSVNPLKVTRHTVISVNPLDYLTSSFGHNWASCHTIDYKNYREMDDEHNYHGMYMSGNLSYMLDETSFVFYTVDSSYNGNEFWTKDKMQRCIFNYQYYKLVQGRVYPDGRDDGDQSYAGQFRTVVQEVLATVLDVPNLWTVSHRISENTVSEGTHYKDYLHYNDPCISILKGNENMKRIHIGHTPICPCCGNSHHNEDSLICNKCKPHYCNRCGEEVDTETGIRIDDDIWYCCEDCAEIAGYVDTVDEGWQREYDCRMEDYTGDWYYYWENRLAVYTEDGSRYLNRENAEADGYLQNSQGRWYPASDFIECPHCGALIYEDGDEWDDELECCAECAINMRREAM